LILGYIDKELSKTGWFVGNDFTAADVQMSFPLEAGTARGGMEGQLPAITGFLKRIHARPAYQRALERGGKYDIVGGD
jgi:glutathione S-transferase